MLRVSITPLMMLVVLAGCPGGNGVIGDSCSGNGDCKGSLQCLNSTCVPRCQRAPDCGDGYSCNAKGLCEIAAGQPGDACTSEVDCAAGLSCQIDGSAVDDNQHLLATCTSENDTRPPGSACETDAECRNGTCALGHCIDLCDTTRDCGDGWSCALVPRVQANGALFAGCLPSQGVITWPIRVPGPSAEILVPVPDLARSAELVMAVDDLNQRVGASSVVSPAGVPIYTKPCSPSLVSVPPCTETDMFDQYYANPLRHLPDVGQSVLAMPSGTGLPLETGAYRVQVSSFRANGSPGSATPHVTALVKLDAGVVLDLHFYFLDLDEHPCADATGGVTLDASTAPHADYFQTRYLGRLRTIFAHGGIAFGSPSYDDIRDHHDLDGLDIADVGSLLALGTHSSGINVFFVRTLSPVGIQAFGPNPGPAGLAMNRQAGIVVALDSLCYRQWEDVARLTAHEIARYMGLYHNVEIGTAQHPTWTDPIDDDDSAVPSSNLMFYSELGGTDLSPGQREILTRSPVLR